MPEVFRPQGVIIPEEVFAVFEDNGNQPVEPATIRNVRCICGATVQASLHETQLCNCGLIWNFWKRYARTQIGANLTVRIYYGSNHATFYGWRSKWICDFR